MKHIHTFESFINESQNFLNEVTIGDSYRAGEYKLTHSYRGNPKLEMPLNDLLERLRELYKMSKKDFPSNKAVFFQHSSSASTKGFVTLPNGVRLEWYKSSPPLVYLQGYSDDKKALEELKNDIERILSEYSSGVSPEMDKAWNAIPEDVKEIFTSAWVPSLEAKNIMSILGSNSLKIDYSSSIFATKQLPRNFTYIGDPKTTNFKVSTGKRTVTFEIHKYNTWTIVTW